MQLQILITPNLIPRCSASDWLISCNLQETVAGQAQALQQQQDAAAEAAQAGDAAVQEALEEARHHRHVGAAAAEDAVAAEDRAVTAEAALAAAQSELADRAAAALEASERTAAATVLQRRFRARRAAQQLADAARRQQVGLLRQLLMEASASTAAGGQGDEILGECSDGCAGLACSSYRCRFTAAAGHKYIAVRSVNASTNMFASLRILDAHLQRDLLFTADSTLVRVMDQPSRHSVAIWCIRCAILM